MAQPLTSPSGGGIVARGMGMNQPTAPHPVLDKYYPSAAHRQQFVGNLFDGAARHYNRLGQLLDLGSGSWYRRRALRRAGLHQGMRLLDDSLVALARSGEVDRDEARWFSVHKEAVARRLEEAAR